MPTQISFITSTLNGLKPHKAEAVQRIRTNALVLLTTLILSYLLPIPSLFTALRTILSSSQHQRWSSEWVWEWICIIEMALVSLLGYNILEASYAIKYPRAPLPPVTSPNKPKAPTASSATPSRSFKILSPNSSPQVQKAFAFSPSASTRSLTSASLSFSTPNGSSKPYVQSPVSTPSRVINYASVPPGSSTTSTTSEYLATPSPVISAYKGRHSGVAGRGVDGQFASRLFPKNEDEDDDE